MHDFLDSSLNRREGGAQNKAKVRKCRTHIRRFPPCCRVVTLTNLMHINKPTGRKGTGSDRAYRLLYNILFFARPLGVFFFSWGSTFGV